MSAILITVLRFGFLILLWLFIFLVVATIRSDVYGTQVAERAGSRPSQQLRSTPRRRSQAPAPAAWPAPAPQPLSQPRLVVVAGPLSGTSIPLGTGAITVGRSPDSALVLDDGFASSRHARFYNEAGEWYIEDLNSTNGTWVGRDRIYHPTHLAPGARITIGKTTMEIQR